MKNDYIRRLQANHLQAEDYCVRARAVLEKQGKHTREEADFYCRAAGCYQENEKLSIGEDQKYYREKKEQCSAKARKIIDELQGVPKEQSAKKSAGTGSKSGSAKSGTSRQGAGGKDNIDVEPWFREQPKHSFADVAGMEELKRRLAACAADAKYAGLKQYLKMRNLNSFFFYGPPGCGKTFLVEAFAHEMMGQGYRYICLEAKDILSKYVGEAESIIARMFELAEESAPCIVFIDEIDGVCKNRNLPKIAEYEASITTAFLTGYNHINSSDKDIVFIGATNFPERVDNAMHSRVELIRMPLPDFEAREGYFKHALEHAVFQCTVSPKRMAEMTVDYDCRDMSRLLELAKSELFQIGKEKYKDSERAIKALNDGELILDEALYQKIYDAYTPFPKKEDKERLDKWENERGGKPQEKKGPFEQAPGQAEDFKACEETPAGGLFDSQDGGWESDGKKKVHNPVPKQDIEKAFYFAKEHYAPETVCYRESAVRYREMLVKELISLMSGEQTEESRKILGQVQEILEKLNSVSLVHSRYEGYQQTGFPESYNGFQTVWQGRAVDGFGGTCGIVGSINVINQQTGSRLREEEGVAAFVRYGLCYVDPEFRENGYKFPAELTRNKWWAIYGSNGGTSSAWRETFIRMYGLCFEEVRDRSFLRRKSFIKKKSTPPEVTLELMEERMRGGESIMLILKMQDLRQPGLSNRIPSEEDPRPFYSNHVTTVAGFSHDENGHVTGMWVNETGGATLSTRVYISEEKFALMRENTRGFSAEFVRK